jgi:hypothetical protein
VDDSESSGMEWCALRVVVSGIYLSTVYF